MSLSIQMNALDQKPFNVEATPDEFPFQEVRWQGMVLRFTASLLEFFTTDGSPSDENMWSDRLPRFRYDSIPPLRFLFIEK